VDILSAVTVQAPTTGANPATKTYGDDTFISLATLQAEVAASTDFADFQSRIAAL
jgi:hypothetical protein